jgi:hypothetical protein
MKETYAHMCRDDHVQIGHNDSTEERCPVCRERDRADAAEDKLKEVENRILDLRMRVCGSLMWAFTPDDPRDTTLIESGLSELLTLLKACGEALTGKTKPFSEIRRELEAK